MPTPSNAIQKLESPRLPILLDNFPIIYEDEEEGDMGEGNLHVLTQEVMHTCYWSHLKIRHPNLQVYCNLDCYYLKSPPHPKTGSLPYFSADAMVVQPFQLLPEDTDSYTIGWDGPVPLQVVEVLSQRSAQQGDLNEKVIIYAMLGIPEYILVDVTGVFLPEKLLLKRLQMDRSWKDEKDADGNVTSNLGFRLVIDVDGQVSVLDSQNGRRYIRPHEAEEAVHFPGKAEERQRALESKLEKLGQSQGKKNQ